MPLPGKAMLAGRGEGVLDSISVGVSWWALSPWLALLAAIKECPQSRCVLGRLLIQRLLLEWMQEGVPAGGLASSAGLEAGATQPQLGICLPRPFPAADWAATPQHQQQQQPGLGGTAGLPSALGHASWALRAG